MSNLSADVITEPNSGGFLYYSILYKTDANRMGFTILTTAGIDQWYITDGQTWHHRSF